MAKSNLQPTPHTSDHSLSICLLNSFIFIITFKLKDFKKEIRQAEAIVEKMAKVMQAHMRGAGS